MSDCKPSIWRLALVMLLLTCATFAMAEGAPAAGRTPRLYIIGDSTVKNGSGKGADGLWGWGDPISAYFDKSKITVVNRALGGRSSRTYYTEGLWERVLTDLKPGDFVLMQFGHNDGGPLSGPKARASIKGNGDETQEVTDARTGKKETVHSYGWYIRKYVSDAKAKGATPIVLSPIPRNMWKEGKVLRASKDYGKWAEEAAKAQGAAFVDLNELIAKKYDELGADKVKGFFPGDHTHTNLAGARFNARTVVEGLKGLKDCPLCDDLAATPPVFEEKP
jgi:rhamnogalacturonan acetylesterase